MLQLSAVKPDTLELLNELMRLDYLQEFFLVGGTALALQLGHRLSEDLDLFTQNSFNYQSLLDKLNDSFPNLSTENEADNTLMIKVRSIKVDFIRHNYHLLESPIVENEIRMWSRKDISAMKLGAIAGRGAKKDFYDLYYLLQEYGAEELLNFFKKKYNQQQIFHVLRSMQYFDDAETTLNPVSLKNLQWKTVKETIVKTMNDFVRKQ